MAVGRPQPDVILSGDEGQLNGGETDNVIRIRMLWPRSAGALSLGSSGKTFGAVSTNVKKKKSIIKQISSPGWTPCQCRERRRRRKITHAACVLRSFAFFLRPCNGVCLYFRISFLNLNSRRKKKEFLAIWERFSVCLSL